ncbi:MAG: DUF4338 domain-containing protein [Candidatus Pacearchaeota archaeon]
MLAKYSKCGRTFKDEEINLIIKIVKENYHTCRCEISRLVCKALNWYSENGKPKEWICREFLIRLEQDKLIELPKPKPSSFNRFKKDKFNRVVFTEPENIFTGKLGDFDRPIFKKVSNPTENTFWEYLVHRYHYLGYYGVMGRFIKYIIYLENVPMACIGFTGAALRVRCRDEFIGWDEETRRDNLRHIANNFRFIIFPWAQIKYLASHILSKSIPLLVRDWEEQYNVKIYMVETFIEKSRFQGTSYRAANWTCVGTTKGYAKTKTGYTRHGVIKDVYLYPACKDYLRLLRCNS